VQKEARGTLLAIFCAYGRMLLEIAQMPNSAENSPQPRVLVEVETGQKVLHVKSITPMQKGVHRHIGIRKGGAR
jgi:hypothetical protein